MYEGSQLCIVAIYVADLMVAGSTLTVVNDVKSLFQIILSDKGSWTH